MRREPALAVLLCLLGAFAVLVAAGRPWLTGLDVLPDPLPATPVALDAGDLGLPAQGLGLAGLAGVLALAATRGAGRVVVGALLLLAGLGVAASAVLVDLADAAGRDDLGRTGWPLLALLGGLLLAAAGALTAVRGRRWSALGRRYEPPAARATARPSGERELWESLDRGEDPTGPEQPPRD